MLTRATPFTLAAASVSGSRHRADASPNQDAVNVASRGPRTAAVVCDGCGSAPASGIGAYLGARLVTQAVLDAADDNIATPYFWQNVTDTVATQLAKVTQALGGDRPEAVLTDACLFTIVGVLSDPVQTVFFALGDGVIGCNRESFVLGPFPDNAPPYLAYRLLDGRDVTIAPVLHRPTAEIDRFFIATDGANDFYVDDATGTQPWPEALEDARFLSHPDALRRRLTQLSRSQLREPAVLRDDTTIVLGGRL